MGLVGWFGGVRVFLEGECQDQDISWVVVSEGDDHQDRALEMAVGEDPPDRGGGPMGVEHEERGDEPAIECFIGEIAAQ